MTSVGHVSSPSIKASPSSPQTGQEGLVNSSTPIRAPERSPAAPVGLLGALATTVGYVFKTLSRWTHAPAPEESPSHHQATDPSKDFQWDNLANELLHHTNTLATLDSVIKLSQSNKSLRIRISNLLADPVLGRQCMARVFEKNPTDTLKFLASMPPGSSPIRDIIFKAFRDGPMAAGPIPPHVVTDAFCDSIATTPRASAAMGRIDRFADMTKELGMECYMPRVYLALQECEVLDERTAMRATFNLMQRDLDTSDKHAICGSIAGVFEMAARKGWHDFIVTVASTVSDDLHSSATNTRELRAALENALSVSLHWTADGGDLLCKLMDAGGLLYTEDIEFHVSDRIRRACNGEMSVDELNAYFAKIAPSPRSKDWFQNMMETFNKEYVVPSGKHEVTIAMMEAEMLSPIEALFMARATIGQDGGREYMEGLLTYVDPERGVIEGDKRYIRELLRIREIAEDAGVEDTVRFVGEKIETAARQWTPDDGDLMFKLMDTGLLDIEDVRSQVGHRITEACDGRMSVNGLIVFLGKIASSPQSKNRLHGMMETFNKDIAVPLGRHDVTIAMMEAQLLSPIEALRMARGIIGYEGDRDYLEGLLTHVDPERGVISRDRYVQELNRIKEIAEREGSADMARFVSGKLAT